MNQTISNRINQIKSGQVPEGYEKTSFGIFPVDWEKEKHLQDICTINPKTEKLAKEFIYIDLESVVDGRVINKNIIKRKNAPSRAQRVLEINDVIYQMVRPYQKNNYIYRSLFDMQTVASTGYAQLRGKVNEFIFQLVNSNYFCNQVLDKCTGTNYPAINSSDLAKVKIAYPKSQSEQAKIAEILMKWDEAIEAQQQLIQKLEIRKKALMQKLLTPKEGWEKIKLSSDIIEIHKSRRMSQDGLLEGKYPFYTNTSDNTTKFLDEYDLDGTYIIANTGGVAYFNYHCGKFAYMSDCYVFKMLNNSTEYVFRYLKSKENEIQKLGFTGSGLKHLDKKWFKKLRIHIPKTIEEQKRIANILSLADKEIELHKQQLEQLTKQRKSMMQLLLTGIVRTVTMDNCPLSIVNCIKEKIIMAKNKPYGDNARKGMVKDRSQVHNPKTDLWVKRDTETGKFMDNKTSSKDPFKGVRKEK